MRIWSARTLLVLATAALTACGGDDSTGPRGELDAERAFDLFSALTAAAALFEGAPPVGMIGRLPSTAPTAMARRVAREVLARETASCPFGGTAEASEQTLSPTSSAFTLNLNNCGVEGDSGERWTLSGSPALRMQFSTTVLSATRSRTLSDLTGNIRFSSGGTSGSCAMSYRLDITEDTATGAVTGSLTGSICGQAVSVSL
jgi:hypothetical protein